MLFSRVAAPFCSPTARVSFSLHPHRWLLFVDFLVIAIWTGVRQYLIVVLIQISQMISDVVGLSTCLLTTCMSPCCSIVCWLRGYGRRCSVRAGHVDLPVLHFSGWAALRAHVAAPYWFCIFSKSLRPVCGYLTQLPVCSTFSLGRGACVFMQPNRCMEKCLVLDQFLGRRALCVCPVVPTFSCWS